MPRIDTRYMNCVAFLYPNTKAAESGSAYGGSGFLLTIPFEQEIDGELRSHVYVITNSHVIREFNSPVIRLNKSTGEQEIIPNTIADWHDDWNQDDLAVCKIDDTKMRLLQWLAPEPHDLVTEEQYQNQDIEIGDDVIMIGRFVGYDGKQQNLPIVRFGTVAMWPIDPVQHPRQGLKQDSWLIECHSIPGTSGSPVFTTKKDDAGYTVPDKLLGINWGYPPHRVPVYRNKTKEEFANIYGEMPSGIGAVIPSWNLMKFLNRSDMVDARKKFERDEQEKAQNQTGGMRLAGASPEDDEPNFTRADFESALRKVSKPKDDQPVEGKSETSE